MCHAVVGDHNRQVTQATVIATLFVEKGAAAMLLTQFKSQCTRCGLN